MCSSISAGLNIQYAGSTALDMNFPFLASISGPLTVNVLNGKTINSLSFPALLSLNGDLKIVSQRGNVGPVNLPQLFALGSGAVWIGQPGFSGTVGDVTIGSEAAST